jgi:hypothetical protein
LRTRSALSNYNAPKKIEVSFRGKEKTVVKEGDLNE